MIRGRVDDSGAVLIRVGIMDIRNRLWPIQAALDTGFTGDLSLPGDVIQRLGLSALGQRDFTLADGVRSLMNSYSGRVFWHEGLSEVVVIQSRGTPLIGMGLLWDSRVKLEAIDEGEVVIEEIPLP